jgi:hypothetical protein
MEPAYGIKHVNVLETILRRARRLVETSRCIGRQSDDDDDGQNKLVQIIVKKAYRILSIV